MPPSHISRPLCDHKLPTSCALTSTGSCCACADERPHQWSYPRYIDGVGLTQSGTRWQNYCPSCKVFWQTRIRISRLEPRYTRIPQYPDQRLFCFHWRRLRENRRGFHLEPWASVELGRLPRTLEQIRLGFRSSQLDADTVVPLNIDLDDPRSLSNEGEGIVDVLNDLLEEFETTQPGSFHDRSNREDGDVHEEDDIDDIDDEDDEDDDDYEDDDDFDDHEEDEDEDEDTHSSDDGDADNSYDDSDRVGEDFEGFGVVQSVLHSRSNTERGVGPDLPRYYSYLMQGLAHNAVSAVFEQLWNSSRVDRDEVPLNGESNNDWMYHSSKRSHIITSNTALVYSRKDPMMMRCYFAGVLGPGHILSRFAHKLEPDCHSNPTIWMLAFSQRRIGWDILDPKPEPTYDVHVLCYFCPDPSALNNEVFIPERTSEHFQRTWDHVKELPFTDGPHPELTNFVNQAIGDITIKFPPTLSSPIPLGMRAFAVRVNYEVEMGQSQEKKTLDALVQKSAGLSCRVCMEEPLRIMCSPCGHLALCEACAKGVWKSKSRPKCPVCRGAVKQIHKVYF